MNTTTGSCIFIVATLFAMQAMAQDDMMAQLAKEAQASPEKTIATFKATRIINVESSETVKKANLDFHITHLFGNVGNESGGGIHTLYGFDQSNDIRLSFMYGITDRLNIGFSRLKRNEHLVGELKFKALEQTVDGKMPFTVTLYGNMAYTPKINPTLEKTAYRFSYFAQAIIAKKFSPHFSFEVLPSLLHRNLVEEGDKNNLFSIAGGGRFKFTRSASLIADYVYTVGRPELSIPHYQPLGVGLEIETGGHVFSLMLTNASGILENDYIPNTVDNWGDGGFKFYFHISRMFTFAKKEPSKAR
jgi:hypothetical protein